jgi:multicomponent Na+:H+ antiporter subunit G
LIGWAAAAREVVVLGLAWLGTLFVVLAAVGVLRMPDLFSRLQASSKAATLGVVCLLVAVAIHFGDSRIWFKASALGAFLFLTAPIAAHLIARAGFVTGAPLAEETAVNEAEELEEEYARADATRDLDREGSE